MIEIRIRPHSPEDLARVIELLKSFGGTLGFGAAVGYGSALGGAEQQRRAEDAPAAAPAPSAAVLAFPTIAAPAPEPEPAQAVAPAPAPAAPAGPSLEDVRRVLAELSAAGKATQVRALLGEVGAKRLTDVAPEHYAELLAKAAAL